jgi:hypothetical protein
LVGDPANDPVAPSVQPVMLVVPGAENEAWDPALPAWATATAIKASGIARKAIRDAFRFRNDLACSL